MQEYPEPPTLEVGQFKAVAKSHHIGNKPDTGRYTFAWKYRQLAKLAEDWGRFSQVQRDAAVAEARDFDREMEREQVDTEGTLS